MKKKRYVERVWALLFNSLLVFMDTKDSYIELVKQAQLGDEKCMNRLAELARERLRVYVYRLVLTDDLTQDILQESILEMFKSIGKLKKVDRFWPWLFRIAGNKVKHHCKQERRRKTVPLSEIGYKGENNDRQEDVAGMISQELKQSVIAAMHKLKPQQQNVLFLRCYEELKYSEIAEAIGCSEIGAQMRFLRAKKALSKQLSRSGLDKGSLLMALVLFGKMTAPSKAAAAQIVVTAATTKVGAAASAATIAASKTAIVSLTTAGVVVVGSVVATSGPGETAMQPAEQLRGRSTDVRPIAQRAEASGQYWYYFPDGPGGAVIMQYKQQARRQWLQDEQANYYIQKGAVHIKDSRAWREDMYVWRLPTDSAKLSRFISKVEGVSIEAEQVDSKASGLLVITEPDTKTSRTANWLTRYYTVLDEDYFRCDWPSGTKIVDDRNAMHQRGWTYFTVAGDINGRTVTGAGRIPFVYATSENYWPWMRLRVGGDVFVDEEFAGLSRPWAGLHTIDTVRRDAAERQIRFETRYNKRSGKAKVVLKPENGQIIYTIDMKHDLIEKIDFIGQRQGQLIFNYLTDINNRDDRFAKPRNSDEGFSILDF